MSLPHFWYVFLGRVLLSLQLAPVPAFCCALRLALRFVVLLIMRSLLIKTNQLAVEDGTVVLTRMPCNFESTVREMQKGLGDGLWSGEGKWGR